MTHKTELFRINLIFALLWAQGSASIKELAVATHSNESRVRYHVKAMTHEGVLILERDPENRRRFLVKETPDVVDRLLGFEAEAVVAPAAVVAPEPVEDLLDRLFETPVEDVVDQLLEMAA